MTQVPRIAAPPFGWERAARDAARAAEAAAGAAGISIRELDEPAALEQISRLLSVIWKDPSAPQEVGVLRALAMTGNYVAAAFRDGRPVGASVAFFGAGSQTIYSHVTGAVRSTAGRRVGFALKLHQRAWALHRGVCTITWTFDPLIRRNAYFNIAKLGASVVEYLPNFYGELPDPINAGDESDRLLIRWDLLAPSAVAASGGSPAGIWDGDPPPSYALRIDRDGAPRRGPWTGSRAVLQVPADIESTRVTDLGLAKAWRLALRETLGLAMTEGATVVGFNRTEGYLVEAAAKQ